MTEDRGELAKRLRQAFLSNSVMKLDPLGRYAAPADPEARYQSLFLGTETTPAELFLLNSRLSPHRVSRYSSHSSPWDLAVFNGRRVTRGARSLKLPAPTTLVTTVSEAIQARRSCRTFSGAAVPLKTLASLLFFAAGVTGRVGTRDPIFNEEVGLMLRAHPSAGALYPITLYLVPLAGASPLNGVHRYDPLTHALEAITSARAVNPSDFLVPMEGFDPTRVSVFIALVAEIWSTLRKYGDRGARYMLIESGEIAENLHLAATALHLGTLDIGGFYDQPLEALLEIDGLQRQVLHLIAIGEKNGSD